MTRPVLKLAGASSRHPGLSRAVAVYFLEAARVCLSRHHRSPVRFQIVNESRQTHADVRWKAPPSPVQRAHNNRDDATRDAAYLCVIAAAELLDGWVAVARAETSTGADYYLGPPGHAGEDLEDCWRLEVSGINDGTPRDVTVRLRQKVAQAQAGNSNLPAIAGVIGFSTKLIALKIA